MKTKENILDTLKQLFLATQDSVKDIPDGSVIKSILYAFASGMEDVYRELDSGLLKLYVDKASGEYLDSLIQGLIGMERLSPRRSIGYVLLEFGEPITDETIGQLVFSFANYVQETDYLNSEITGTVKIPVSPKPGLTFNVVIIPPQTINAEPEDFEIDETTGLQTLFAQFRDFLLSIYTSTGKPVKYAILPVATELQGKQYVLNPGEIDTILNLGIPVKIKNLYVRQNAKLNQYSIADPDGINSSQISPVEDSIYIGEMSRILGGRDLETDDEYRERYYLYLSSLNRGTEKAIELGLSSAFPSIDVRSISTNKKGEVDVILYTQKPVTPNILTKMYEVLRDYRPVGIKINIFTTNTIPIVILFDAQAKEIKIAAEKSKSILYQVLQEKSLGETLTYTDIHESLDIPSIVQIFNVYYGMYLTSNLFELYKTTILSSIQELAPVVSPSFSYRDYYSLVVNSPDNIYLFDASRAYNGYPLIEFVRKAKSIPNPSTLPSPLDSIVSAIQSCPAGVRDIDCLEALIPYYPTLRISLKNVDDLMGPEHGIYYKLKFLTIPNVLHTPSTIAENLIDKFIKNDILLLTNKDKKQISVNGAEKLILGYDEIVNSRVFKDSSTVGVRKYEPID